MTNILRVDSSSRMMTTSSEDTGFSHSRALADKVLEQLQAQHLRIDVVTRDIITDPLPHLTNATIEGFFASHEMLPEKSKAGIALSDRMIKEIHDADILLLSAPLYNFSIPSALKAWIDHVVRMGHTFSYEDGAFKGLLRNKKAYICCAYGAGGYTQNRALASYDFMAPYLTMILNFIGISDVTTFNVEATTADAGTVTAQTELAHTSIAKHFEGIAT